jgi:hypothetical protein
MPVWICINTAKEVADENHLKVFATRRPGCTERNDEARESAFAIDDFTGEPFGPAPCRNIRTTI